MRWIGVVLVSVLAAGCAPSHVAVRPQSSDLLVSKDLSTLAAFVRVPETGAGGLDVRVSSNGAFRHKHKDDKSVTLSIEVEVENRAESVTAYFDPGSATLTAGYKRDLAPVAPVVTGSDAKIAIEPGARRTFRLEFATHGTGDPRELTPFALKLVFDYGASTLPVAISFVREEPIYYGYPSYYYPYDPYFYPGHRFGWGPGFYGGAGWGW